MFQFMKSYSRFARYIAAIIFFIGIIFVFRGTTNSLAYWVVFLPVQVIRLLVAAQNPPQGAVELSSLALGSVGTAFYWYSIVSIFGQGQSSKKH